MQAMRTAAARLAATAAARGHGLRIGGGGAGPAGAGKVAGTAAAAAKNGLARGLVAAAAAREDVVREGAAGLVAGALAASAVLGLASAEAEAEAAAAEAAETTSALPHIEHIGALPLMDHQVQDDEDEDDEDQQKAGAKNGQKPAGDRKADGDKDADSGDEDEVEFEDGAKFYIPPAEESKFKIFSGNGNWYLANEVSMHLGVQLGRATVKRFADGEVSVNILDNVRGKDVFVIQPLGPPVNENLMELLLMVTTLRRSSARCITAVIPYYGYCRSTRKGKDTRTPIGAADVAKMLQVAGVDHVIAVDLHHSQIMGMFGPGTAVDNLDVSSLAIPYFETKFLRKPVVVSPDANGAARAKIFRDKLIRRKIDSSLAIIVDHNSKKRGWEKEGAKKGDIQDWTAEELEGMELVGEVEGHDCIIFDDMVDSAGRITRAAKKLKLAGARRVFAFTTHGLFLGNAYERIEKSELIEVVCVNTVPLATSTVRGVNSWVYSNKVHQLSVAALLAESIRRINKKKSVSKL